jgi:hypothetical protein
LWTLLSSHPHNANITEDSAKRGELGRRHSAEAYVELHKQSLELSKAIRPLLPTSRPVLFHGTRFPRTILGANALVADVDGGEDSLHFTRMLPVATYYALLDRKPDEGRGAVLALDRDLLAQKYKLECTRDPFWDNVEELSKRKYFEAEEIIFGRDVTDLHKYLVGVAWIDDTSRFAQSANAALEPLSWTL